LAWIEGSGMALSVENICGLLIRSRLMTPASVKSAYQRWQTDANHAAADVRKFARWLVRHDYVTEFQAALLLRGQADHFFLGEYKLLERLGQGRMATVYKAVHQLGQVVAIKVLAPAKAKEAQFLARFQREARLACRLSHPHVVRAFQVGASSDVHYLVMEYLEGETLRQVLKRRGKLPPAEAVRLACQALVGLQHLHEQGLVHRDLKPANLMLVPASARPQADSTLDAVVKILDIGLGRALFDEALLADGDNLTTEGTVMGTPDYLAPEQARNSHGVDIRADVYSLGCVLYHMLAGQPPFPDQNLINQIYRHATEAPPALDVPDGLQQVINRMMAKDPAQRYSSPAEALLAVEDFLPNGGATARPRESDACLRSYLAWLDTQQPERTRDEALATRDASPSAKDVRPKVQAAPAVGKLVRGSQREHSGRAAPAAVPTIEPSPPAEPPHQASSFLPVADVEEADPVLDVELAPVAEVVIAYRGHELTRRDLLMLGVGAGSVVVAGLVGALAAWWSKRPARSPSEASDSARANE
jgi:serine/threonine protein kinase